MDNQDYISVKDLADQWGLTVRRVQMMCMQGLIPGAVKQGRFWVVPVGAQRPQDKRVSELTSKRPGRSRADRNLSAEQIMSMRFLTAMSSEMRNELNTIMGYSDMLVTHTDEPDRICDFASYIKDSGKNILRQIENTILLSKISNDEVYAEESVCSLSELVQGLADSAAVDAQKRDVKLTCRMRLDHEFVYVDSDKLKILLSNVIDNALKYSKSSGKVILSAEEVNYDKSGLVKVRFCVEDNGRGMTAPFLKHLFDNFSADRARNEDGLQNIGIGLAIVKGLTEILGGTLDIQSKLGSGTKVYITMEYRIADLTEVKEEETFEFDLDVLSGHRVLIADDNEMNRDIAMEIFSDAGVHVDCAEDGIICVATLEKAEPGYYDCIFMDIQMPNLNGLEATRIIRTLSDSEKANIPIIAMTANVQDEDREMTLRAGMNGFVEKPFDIKKMYSMLQRALKD